MSSVVDASVSDADEDDRDRRDPYRGDRIEVDESALRAVSPAAWIEGTVRRLDAFATRLVRGR